MSGNDAGDRQLAAQAAEALRRPRGLPVAIAALMLLAGFGLWFVGDDDAALAMLVLALLSGAVAAYAIARARYDAAVFGAWAAADDLPAAVARFDARWSRTTSGRSRPMAERVAGALRWKQRGLIATGAQGGFIAAGLWPLRHLLD
jgi:hypothetical protein